MAPRASKLNLLIIIFSLEFAVNHPEWTIPSGDPTSKPVMGSNSPDRHIHLLLLSPHGTKTFKRIRAQGCAIRSAVPFSSTKMQAFGGEENISRQLELMTHLQSLAFKSARL